MKIIRRIIAAVMVAAVSLTTLATTAFAWGKDLVDLSDDERFDEVWKEVTRHYMGLEASLMHEELEKFISQLEITTVYGYDVDEAYKDFEEWYENRHKDMKTDLYDKEVAAYLKEHPESDLWWTDGAGSKQGELRVYDSNILVATVKNEKSRDEVLLMQYTPQDISHMIIWKYDADKEQFIGSDENGKLVKKVAAYSKPYIYKNDASTPEQSYTSSVVEQDESEDTEVSELQESYAETSSVMVDDPMVSEDNVVAVEVSDDKSETAVGEPREESAVKASNDTAAVSKETVEADTSMVAEESAAEQENSNNDNSTTTIIIICGVVIAGVFAFLIIRQKKKKV